MGKKQKAFVQKLMATFLACSMTIGLMPGTMTTTWAEENESSKNQQQESVLCVTADLERDQNYNIIGVDDNASWIPFIGCDIDGIEVCFGIGTKQNEDEEEYQWDNQYISADQLEVYEAHLVGEDKQIDENVTDNAEIIQESGNDWMSLQFKKDGLYVIQLKGHDKTENNQIDVMVTLPSFGFYRAPEISADNYLPEDVEFGKADGLNEVYLIAKDEEGASFDPNENVVFSCNWDHNPDSYKYYIDAEEINIDGAVKAYKITFKKNQDFYLEAHCVYKETSGEDSFENYARGLNLHYAGDQPEAGQEDMILYDGEDGEDFIGYSGCYITEEAYQRGSVWFNGGFPNGVYYWVHGRTIQEVVDKLLELDGQTCEMWGIKEDRETEVTIENSGFIYLNMSYRDSSYKDTVEAEQYVYAPASIKGILMDTASNAYSVPTVEPNGTPITEEDDRPIYNDVYEFPLTTEAQDAEDMKAYKLDGTSTEITYDATNSAIKYLHGIVLPEGYVEDFKEELKNLPELTEGKRLIQKTTYDRATDSWKTESVYYLISAEDIVKPADVDEPNIEQYGVLQKDPHRWPSLHVNASTQVRVQGLWTENANLYIGFYDGVDSVNTYVDEQRFTNEKIGTSTKVTYPSYSVGYDPAKNRIGDEQANADNNVTVHVVKAESNTNIQDTYSEDGKTASIDVDKEAISDLVPMEESEKEALIDGASLDLNLEVSGVDASSDANVIKAENDIKAALGNGKKADFFNALLNYTLKKADGTKIADNKPLTEMEDDMVLSFPLKTALQGKKNYVVYRYHDGKVEKLNAWIDEETGNLCFETDRFSVYAIAVDDETSGGGSSSGGGATGGSTGGGSSVTPTPAPTPTLGETTTETKTEITVENTVKPGKNGTVKTTISASVVKQMTDAAGTTDLIIKQTVKDTSGNVLYTVETKAENLTAGKKLTLVKIVNGKKVLVSKPVTVSKNGNVSVKAEKGEYQLIDEEEAKALKNEILKTVTPKKSNVSIKKGKKTTIQLNSKLDMDNVAKITYTSSNKSAAKVDKNGKVTAKKKGTVTITIAVTLNDGTVKKVKVKMKVK